MKNQWVKLDNGDWNYYGDDGNLVNGWREIDDKWYFFKDYIMVTGWFKDSDERWYYMRTSTDSKCATPYYKGELTIGWVLDNDHYYYMCETTDTSKCIYRGQLITGWILWNEKYYYSIETSCPEKSEYLGQMICNCSREIAGNTYNFDNNGVWIESTNAITASQLQQVGWYSKYINNTMLADLSNCCSKFEINTPARLRHFISQCSHESGCGYYMVEDASGSAYEGRSDLGNTQSGDGSLFKGGGYIQITGRTNYQNFANYIGDQQIMVDGATYVGTNYGWSSAGYWWSKNNMNALCDSGASCTTVTKRVNGGTNGLSERQRYYNLCCNIF